MNNCTSTAWILINSTRFERGRSQFSLALISAASLIARKEMGQVPLCSPLAAEKQLSFSQEEEEERQGGCSASSALPSKSGYFWNEAGWRLHSGSRG